MQSRKYAPSGATVCNPKNPGPSGVTMSMHVSARQDQVDIIITEIVCGEARNLTATLPTKDFKSFQMPEFETAIMKQMVNYIALRFGVLQDSGFTFEP